MKTLRYFLPLLLLVLAVPTQSAFAYGGGNGGGQEESSFGGGSVSWTPNPNGVDVIGSSIYSGRPAVVEKGPYQKDTAVQDAEEALLKGYKQGSYTADEVKANLEWAQRVGVEISDEARDLLNKLKSPPPKSTPQSKQTTATSKDKQADKIAKAINLIADYNRMKAKQKSTGKKTTQLDLAIIGLKNTLRDNVPQDYKGWVDKAFEFFGY